MFEIKYDFTGSEDDELIDPDEMSLKHKHFPGNLLFRKDNSSICIDHQRMAIIDSAFSLLNICSVLLRKKNGREDFEFSQSDKKITFQKEGNNVKIIPSFSVVTLEMTVEDFRGGIKQFYRDVIFKVMLKSDSLKINAMLFTYLKEVERI